MTDLPNLTNEQRALLALTMISGLGPRLIAALLERFGSAEGVLRASPSQLSQVPHISDRLASEFRQAMDAVSADEELERMRQHRVHPVFVGEPEYPPLLARIKSAPPVLYVRGTLEGKDENAVALVGSRSCTAYGRRVTEQIATGLARAGWTVISGLARGIDGAAHRGALAGGGRTLAILAGGLSSLYPPEHKDLAAQVEQQGALVTEFNMRMEPLPVLFPMRNRIISGISRAVVVIEANQQSGALITAKHALEQGRDVFAVPGPVDSAASAGTLQLLRDGAHLVRHADDILEDLRGIPMPTRRTEKSAVAADGNNLFETVAANANAPNPTPPVELDETQHKIWEFLAGGVRSPDEMAQELGINPAQLPSTLLMMEMKKAIRRLPGNRYERC